MSTNEPNDPGQEKAWELLKSAKPVEPGPFFSRNVVREVRLLEESRKAGWFARLRKLLVPSPARAMLIGVSACAAITLIVVATNRGDSTAQPHPPVAVAEDAAEVFDPATEIAEVEYFGQLMAVADPAQLDDAALAELFF